MRRVLSGVGMALVVAARAATPQGLTIDWSHAAAAGGRVLPGQGPDGASALELRAEGPGGAALHLTTIERPPLASGAYVVSGMVRYEGVEGQGYLEMWSVFPDSQRFFTRTLAPRGPLAALHGDSKWRRFELPFTPGTETPSRLEINLVLPGRGSVVIGPLRLDGYSASGGTTAGAWWSQRAGLLFGVALGSFLGILGGAIGVLAGRGKARRAVLRSLTAMIVVGGALALLGAAAILTAQPRYVWYPALSLGGLAAMLGIVLSRPLRMRYAADELRRMQAMDARGARGR